MAGRKEKKRCFDLFEINCLSQRLKCSGGNLVALIKFLNDFEKIKSRQIDGPRVPFAERGFETSKSEGTKSFLTFEQLSDLFSFHRPGAPELEHFVAEYEPVTETHDLPKDLHCGAVGKCRQHGGGGLGVDWSRSEHQFTNLARKPSSIDERHPAALAQTDQIDRRANLIDEHIEVGQIIVDPEKSHVGRGRVPVGGKQVRHAGVAERGNKAMPSGEIAQRRTV